MSWLVPYIPTPLRVVRKMLSIARTGVDDVVFDLGCGDGRILITAMKEFGVKKAVGYEIRRDLCEFAWSTVVKEGLKSKIEIVHGDLFEAPVSEATVITLYLDIAFNKRLKPKLRAEARTNTRIVSRYFEIAGWAVMEKEHTCGNALYLYKISK